MKYLRLRHWNPKIYGLEKKSLWKRLDSVVPNKCCLINDRYLLLRNIIDHKMKQTKYKSIKIMFSQWGFSEK